MIVRQSVFARLCGVKPPSISECIAKGLVHKTDDGKIDLDNPVNRAYLDRHGGQVPADQIPSPSPAAPQSSAPPPGKSPRRAAASTEAPLAAPSPKPEKRGKKKPDAASLALAAIRAGQAAADEDDASDPTGSGMGDLSAAELQDILRRSLYEARKIKNEEELKAVQLDIKHGSLVPREIVESIILQFAQAIQQDFVDCIQGQALKICTHLGKMGFEYEVQDILTGDNDKRLQRILATVQELVNAKYIRTMSEKIKPIEDSESEATE